MPWSHWRAPHWGQGCRVVWSTGNRCGVGEDASGVIGNDAPLGTSGVSVQTVPSPTLLVNSKTPWIATLHPTVEGQRDRGCCVKQCSPMLLEIQWLRLNQQSQRIVYISAEISDCVGSLLLLQYQHLVLTHRKPYFASTWPSCSPK